MCSHKREASGYCLVSLCVTRPWASKAIMVANTLSILRCTSTDFWGHFVNSDADRFLLRQGGADNFLRNHIAYTATLLASSTFCTSQSKPLHSSLTYDDGTEAATSPGELMDCARRTKLLRRHQSAPRTTKPQLNSNYCC